MVRASPQNLKTVIKEYYKVAEITAAYKPKRANHPKVTDADNARRILRHIWDDNTIGYFESFFVMALDTKGRLLGVSKISDGGSSVCHVDIKRILQLALISNAQSIIVAHNHPSGDVNPSHNDKDITLKLNTACRAIDIKLVDHIIITDDDYYSFNENGQL